MKKAAVISDIHGNYKALEAFLNYIKENPVDKIICLGDYVTDSPYPERIMELLYDMQKTFPCDFIRGNRENYLLENAKENKHWKPSSANGALYYTALHLSEKDITFFEGLLEEKVIEMEGYPSIFICHGTPGDVRGNVTLQETLKEEALRSISYDYLLGGHSHQQEIYFYHNKMYVNPGSLGLAIDGVGKRAEFAMLTGTASFWKPELVSIPYDVDSFLQDFTESGLDKYGMVLTQAVKKTLLTGVNYFFQSVLEVQKQSNLPLSEIPESIWNKTAEDLKL